MGVTVLAALLLDQLFSEPRRFHPLVGFGRIVEVVEKQLNQSQDQLTARLLGLCGWLLCVMPWVLIAVWLENSLQQSGWYLPVAAVVLYLTIGWQSLLQHAQAVAEPLFRNDLDQARTAVSMIVSRDTAQLDSEGVARAATESVLENGADAIFSALFWFCIAGLPGVVLYRLSNTLDAMWGYKNQRFLYFGWAAARIDDLLNLIPARLTALSYAVMGNFREALACWRLQGSKWKSPNAGPVMAAGAGALTVKLGGVARYHDRQQQRPDLGRGNPATPATVQAACKLVNRALALWLIAILIIDWIL